MTSQDCKHGVLIGKGTATRVWIDDVGLVTDFIPSDDLNECVQALVKKPTKNFPMHLARQQDANGALKSGRSKKHRRSSHLSGKKRSYRQTFAQVVRIESTPPAPSIKGVAPTEPASVREVRLAEDLAREPSDSVGELLAEGESLE